MPRLLSVALTEEAVRDRTKTVTRRLGWTFLEPGTRLTLVRKSMGRHNRATGITEPLVRVAEVEVVDVRRERLDAITDDDVSREGFTDPGLYPRETPAEWFVAFFTDAMRCTHETVVTRIEWRYLDDEQVPA